MTWSNSCCRSDPATVAGTARFPQSRVSEEPGSSAGHRGSETAAQAPLCSPRLRESQVFPAVRLISRSHRGHGAIPRRKPPCVLRASVRAKSPLQKKLGNFCANLTKRVTVLDEDRIAAVRNTCEGDVLPPFEVVRSSGRPGWPVRSSRLPAGSPFSRI